MKIESIIEFVDESQKNHFEECDWAWSWQSRTELGLGDEAVDHIYCGCGEWLGYAAGGRRSGMHS